MTATTSTEKVVISRGSAANHRPLNQDHPLPVCTPRGANPWVAYRFSTGVVTCKKCLKKST